MPHIIIDDEQARTITESTDCVEIRDRNGNLLGHVLQVFSVEDIAIAEQRMLSTEPRFTTQQVLDHIRAIAKDRE